MPRVVRGPRPACPKDHPDSHVVFDGHYGAPAHRRQLYRCYPGGVGGKGQPFHRFVPTMQRELPGSGECDGCEREFLPHEGHHVPRFSLYPARDIAAGLVAVGSGRTYQQASWLMRQRTGRWPVDEDGVVRETMHGQLMGDMVEVFAPVLHKAHAQSAWPEGTLVVDSLTMRMDDYDAKGLPINAGKVAFNVMVAVGYQSGRSKVWSLQAWPRARGVEWQHFFRSLPGQPERIVSDAGPGILAAVNDYWPTSDLYL